MESSGWASFLGPWTDSIEKQVISRIMTRIRLVPARTFNAFTKIRPVIYGWVEVAVVLSGSTNARGVSSTTGTNLMIPTA